MPIDAQNLRVDYQADVLLEKDAPDNPFPLFDRWFKEAKDSDDPEPNAMIVATINAEGHPAARTVLLKEVTDRGFVFYTNYDSRKGHELTAHPHAAVVFNWLQLQRSVRIEGKVEKIDSEHSTEYFQSRPKKKPDRRLDQPPERSNPQSSVSGRAQKGSRRPLQRRRSPPPPRALGRIRSHPPPN